ncbi:hypothetical protein BGZ99_003461 [Dissophora globulifera]|uniref:FAD-binding domain-containing protein n=1 Tax=Dissophora globulifera TaxID=979702 RepID=A0A9P6UV27_9FUNG|nr:hypothetical protein BGZ99_003461 [Dissophora globulifera]
MGVQVCIIDRAMAISPLSKAVGIQPRSLEILQMSGLIDQFMERGLPMTDYSIFIGAKKVAERHIFPARSASHYEVGLLLEQSISCTILAEELDKMGVQVDRGWELLDTKVVDENGHTFVETILRRPLSDEKVMAEEKKVVGEVGPLVDNVDREYETQTVRSEYLVAADGARSTVRHKLNIEFPGRTRTQRVMMWDGTFECDDIDMARFARLMVEGDEMEPDEDISKTLQDLTADEFEKVVNGCIAPAKLKIKKTDWLTVFRVNERRADHVVHKNRIFLAGDAAHIQSPSGGQGMNTGLQDVHSLAWKLALVINKVAPAALLETYQEREATGDRAVEVATEMLDFERDAGFITMIKNRIFYSLMHVAIPLMEASGFEDKATMIGVRYHESALNKAHPTQATPAAQFQVGVRAQDGSLHPLQAVIVGTQYSASTRLHELIAGIGRFYILVFTSDMLHSGTSTANAAAIKGVSTTTAKALERNIEDYLSIWRSKWPYGSDIQDGHNDKDLFKIHVIAGSAVLDDSKESMDGHNISIKALADKRIGDGRVYMDDRKSLHKKYGFSGSRGAGGIIVIRPDSYIGYRVQGAGEQAWKDVQDYFNSILTK